MFFCVWEVVSNYRLDCDVRECRDDLFVRRFFLIFLKHEIPEGSRESEISYRGEIPFDFRAEPVTIFEWHYQLVKKASDAKVFRGAIGRKLYFQVDSQTSRSKVEAGLLSEHRILYR